MNIKIFFIGAVATIFSLILSFAFNNQLLVLWLVAGVILLVIMALQSIFVNNNRNAIILIAIESIALSSFFITYSASKWISFLIGVVAFALFFWGYKLGNHRLENNLKISFSELRRHALPIMSTALAVFLISNFSADLINSQKPLTISREVIEVSARPLIPIINKFIPNVGLESSAGSFLTTFSEEVYGPEVDSQLAASQLMDIIRESTGAVIFFRENIIDASHKAINSLLETADKERRQSIILTISTFIFFLVLGGLYFVNLLVVFLAWIIFKALLALNFVNIEIENAQREKVVL